MKEANLFTFLDQIQTKKNTYSYDKKIASAYMLTQFLSMDRSFIKYCNDINKYHFLLSDEIIYKYYINVIPKGKKFIKFIKKRKENEKIKRIVDKIKESNPDLSINECKRIITYLLNKKK